MCVYVCIYVCVCVCMCVCMCVCVCVCMCVQMCTCMSLSTPEQFLTTERGHLQNKRDVSGTTTE